MKDPRTQLEVSTISEYFIFADELAEHARTAVLQHGSKLLERNVKPRSMEPITSLDIEIEQEIRSRIGVQYPDHNIIGEEFEPFQADTDVTWLIDPIDGTDDLVRGSELFGTIIAVLFHGRPIVGVIDHPKLSIRCKAAFGLGFFVGDVRRRLDIELHDPVHDAIVLPAFADFCQLDHFEEIQREINSAFPNQRIYRNVYGHTLVITGGIPVCLEVNVRSWDVAASQIMVEEAGGSFASLCISGDNLRERRTSAVFGHPESVKQVVEIFKRNRTPSTH